MPSKAHIPSRFATFISQKKISVFCMSPSFLVDCNSSDSSTRPEPFTFSASQLKGKQTGIAKHGAAEIRAQVINLVEIDFAILMNSLPSKPKTNSRTFISFNNTPASQTLCRLAAVTEASPPLPLADKAAKIHQLFIARLRESSSERWGRITRN